MTQIWILLMSLLLGALLISPSGADDPEVTKEALKHRLAEIDLRKENLIKNLTEHGLDYFADKLIQDIPMKELYRNLSYFEPKDSKEWFRKLDLIGYNLDSPLSWHTANEYHKGVALYLNAIINVTGKIDSRGQTLVNEVAEIITLENKYKQIVTCHNEHDKDAVETDKVLSDKLVWLVRKLDSVALTERAFFLLEDRAVEDIRLLKSAESVEAANKRQQLLDRFLAINIRLGQTYPLDSHLRMNQYFKIAQEHYRLYTALKEALDSDEK